MEKSSFATAGVAGQVQITGCELRRFLRWATATQRAQVAKGFTLGRYVLVDPLPAQAARLVDIDPGYVSSALGRKGTRGPRPRTIDRVVARFGVRASDERSRPRHRTAARCCGVNLPKAPSQMAAPPSPGLMEHIMFVIFTGGPAEGFTAVGPFQTEDNTGERGESARATYGGADWCELPLHDIPGERDPNGTAIGFDGDITVEFRCYGPFSNFAAALTWAERCGGLALELYPLEDKAEAA